MEIEERLNVLEDKFKQTERRLILIEDEIEKIQKDVQIIGENTKIETPCFAIFENSLTKKLMKESGNGNTNAS